MGRRDKTKELKELFCKEQKNHTSSLGSLWFCWDALKVLNSCLSSVLSFIFFFSPPGFLLLVYREPVGYQTQKKKTMRCLYPLKMSIILPY